MSRGLKLVAGLGGSGITGLTYTITISTNQTNFSLSDEVTNNHAWDGVTPFTANITINAGVVMRAGSTTLWGYRADSATNPTPPSGTKVNITNLGNIKGQGGNGGVGGEAQSTCTNCTVGSGGNAGGPAMKLAGVEHELTNGSGNIWGGGGGGGGGGGVQTVSGEDNTAAGGGGGGGGAGDNVGTGAVGGTPNLCDLDCNGAPGNNGSVTAGGTGGAGCTQSGGTGGAGGTGGLPGAVGATGATATGGDFNCAGGTGGAAGNAIEKNGAALNFISGGTDPNVKGAIV